MCKNVVMLFLILLCIYGCGNKKENVKIKELLVESTLIKYPYSFGLPDSVGIILEKIIFDNQSRDSIKIAYNENGVVEFKSFIFYDLNNISRIIKYDAKGEIYSKTIFIYDEQSRIKLKKEDKTNGEYEYEEYYYAQNGLLIKKVLLTKYYFELLSKWSESKDEFLLIYDDNKKLIFEKYFEKNELSMECEYKYDYLGRKTDCISKNNPREYKYDIIGNVIEEISKDENGSAAYRWTRKYDNEKRLVEEIKHNKLNEPVEKLVKYFKYIKVPSI